MDHTALLSKIRLHCLLVQVQVRAPGKPSDAAFKDAHAAIITAQRNVAGECIDRSISYLDGKRLLNNEGLVPFIRAVGTTVQEYQAKVASLPEADREKYTLDLIYEPVTDPESWGMMPADLATRLNRFMVKRMIEGVNEGIDDSLSRLYSAVNFYIERLGAYHAYMNNPTVTKVILRDVVVLNLHRQAERMAWANLDESENVAGFLDKLTDVLAVKPEALRGDEVATDTLRQKCILEAQLVAQAMYAYLGG